MLVLLLCEPKLARRLGAIRTEKVNGIYNIPVSDCILVSCDDEIWYWPLDEQLRWLKIS